MTKAMSVVLAILVLALTKGLTTMALADNNHLPVSAPVDTDSAGRGGLAALQSVIRIICPQKNTVGTGFLHKSGRVITAAHVVKDCQKTNLILSDGTQLIGTTEAADDEIDLAIVSTTLKIPAATLEITSKTNLQIGTQVSAWGYPAGYFGRAPMLSVGYLAGIDAWKPTGNKAVTKWVVNAAFNGGNSGGPLVLIETGEIIGVVSSKLAPLSPQAISVLQALQDNPSGMQYTATMPDGTSKSFSEAQLVSEVLQELRSQIQLVIGYAVLTDDLKSFLRANGIDP